MAIFCGIDWAEDNHDVAIVNEAGAQLAKRRIDDDAAGFAALLALLAEHGETAEQLAPVAIETGRGLVACLVANGRDVYVINPMAAARYRERTAVARSKSDAGDALMLANILRTDRHAHRPMPKDSEAGAAASHRWSPWCFTYLTAGAGRGPPLNFDETWDNACRLLAIGIRQVGEALSCDRGESWAAELAPGALARAWPRCLGRSVAAVD